MSSTIKTKHMMMLYNSINFSPENTYGYDFSWFVEQELLPIIEKCPKVIGLLSLDVQDYILEYHMEKFIKASLNIPKVRGWRLISIESMTINNPAGFV